MGKREKLIDPYKVGHRASIPTIIPSTLNWKTDRMDLKDPRYTPCLDVKPPVDYYLDTKD